MNRRGTLVCAAVLALATGCGPNPGELGYIGTLRFDDGLEGMLSKTPIATGTTTTLELYDETGSCLTLFPWDQCVEVEYPVRFRSSNPNVADMLLVGTGRDGSSLQGELVTHARGRAELQVLDATGELVDFLPIEVSDAHHLAITDVELASGEAHEIPPDVGLPIGFEIPLRIGLADVDGRMLQHSPFLELDLEVRESAEGFAIGGDSLLDRAPESGSILFPSPPPEEEVEEPLIETSPLGEVPGYVAYGFVIVRARTAGTRLRVAATSTNWPDVYPLDAAFIAADRARGDLAIEARAVEVDDAGEVTQATLCALHDEDGVAQVGWTYEWDAPEGFTELAISHRLDRGGTRRCALFTGRGPSGQDGLEATFSVTVDDLEAEMPMAWVRLHGR